MAVAPITEEVGKAIGSRAAAQTDRRSAFYAGVAAGTGFAVLENILYSSGSGFFGGAWQEIAIARMLGVAVHPLATALVVIGWWEWRNGYDRGPAIRRVLSGMGVHALWNGSLVVLEVVSRAFELGGTAASYAYTSIAYSAAIGAVAAVALWRLTVAVDGEPSGNVRLDVKDARVVAAWVLLSASFVLPVAMLLLAVPHT